MCGSLPIRLVAKHGRRRKNWFFTQWSSCLTRWNPSEDAFFSLRITTDNLVTLTRLEVRVFVSFLKRESFTPTAVNGEVVSSLLEIHPVHLWGLLLGDLVIYYYRSRKGLFVFGSETSWPFLRGDWLLILLRQEDSRDNRRQRQIFKFDESDSSGLLVLLGLRKGRTPSDLHLSTFCPWYLPFQKVSKRPRAHLTQSIKLPLCLFFLNTFNFSCYLIRFCAASGENWISMCVSTTDTAAAAPAPTDTHVCVCVCIYALSLSLSPYVYMHTCFRSKSVPEKFRIGEAGALINSGSSGSVSFSQWLPTKSSVLVPFVTEFRRYTWHSTWTIWSRILLNEIISSYHEIIVPAFWHLFVLRELELSFL